MANTLIDLTEYQYRKSKISKYLDYDEYWYLLQRGFNFDKFINKMEMYEMDKIEILANVEIGEMVNKALRENSGYLTDKEMSHLSALRYDRINKVSKRDEKTLKFLITQFNGYISNKTYGIRYPAILDCQKKWWWYNVAYIPKRKAYYFNKKSNYHYTDFYNTEFCLNEFKKEYKKITANKINEEKELHSFTTADYKLKTMDTKHWSNFYNRILNY